MSEFELKPSDTSLLVIDEAWTSVLNELYALLNGSRFGFRDDAQMAAFRPFNVSTGRFINGVSQCYLKKVIVDHFKMTGRCDNRFIGLEHANEIGLKLCDGQKPQVILRYSNYKVVNQLDESTGELLETTTQLEDPYRSFQSVYHFSQFQVAPESVTKYPEFSPLTVDDINKIMVSVAKVLNIQVRILDKPMASFCLNSRTINLPHPQLFKSKDDFYGQALRQLSKAVYLCAKLPLSQSTGGSDKADEMEMISSLICDLLSAKLLYSIQGATNKGRCCKTISEYSDKPWVLFTTLFAVEQCANFIVANSTLDVRLLSMHSAYANAYGMEVTDILNRFSEKPVKVEAIEQNSESITIEL